MVDLIMVLTIARNINHQSNVHPCKSSLIVKTGSLKVYIGFCGGSHPFEVNAIAGQLTHIFAGNVFDCMLMLSTCRVLAFTVLLSISTLMIIIADISAAIPYKRLPC